MRDFNDLKYLSGFCSYFSSEALPNALPKGQNNPQCCPYGLYAEQLSGTSFTTERSKNRFSWLYRGCPSAANHSVDRPLLKKTRSVSWVEDVSNTDGEEYEVDPNQLRWNALPIPSGKKVTFLNGVTSLGKGGDNLTNTGCHVYVYQFNSSMIKQTLTNRDGDFLFVPQQGKLFITTEFGKLTVEPTEIFVVGRGMRFQIEVDDSNPGCRGYILELHEGHFQLPELGPIGANGLANQRDFLSPVASFDDKFGNEIVYEMIEKFDNNFFVFTQDHTPFDVVAWHGNYHPYKYDLKKFCCINSVTYDHPDPSIYTVLTAPSTTPGTAAVDFVIFPPRWMVMENTFRPPWFHRNFMTEYMGLIWGGYDAKKGGKEGFVQGGGSLHQCMAPHGPDFDTYSKMSSPRLQLEPEFFDKGLAFMFETCYPLKLSRFARSGSWRQQNYQACWNKLKCSFNEKWKIGDNQNKGSNILEWKRSKI